MDDSLKSVKDVFDSEHFNRILVVDSQGLQGVVTDKDLLMATHPKHMSTTKKNADWEPLDQKVQEVMCKDPVMLDVSTGLDDAIEIFLENRLSFIPVVSSEFKPLGIVSWRDVLAATEGKREYDRNGLRQAINALALVGESKDPYTANHMSNVSHWAEAVGKELGFSKDRLEGLKLGASIHDIGKISVPLEILNKPGKLTKWEFGMIAEHSVIGYNIVKDIQFDWPIKEIIRQHHERIDGSGYPDGLKGDEITLEAKIVAVADTFDAIISHRPYRSAHAQETAIEVLKSQSAIGYDPEVVEIVLGLLAKDCNFSVTRH